MADDFQVISASYILSRVNLKSQHSKQTPVHFAATNHLPTANHSLHANHSAIAIDPAVANQSSVANHSKKSEQLFRPGCGHKECVHCENKQNPIEKDAKTSAVEASRARHSLIFSNIEASFLEEAPKLPPKPPWMSLPLPPPVIIPSRNITNTTTSDVSISVSSDSSEQETVIYGKNVKIARKNSHPETNSETTKYSSIGTDQVDNPTKNRSSICTVKSVKFCDDSSADLEKSTVRGYIREIEDEKCEVEKKINDCDKLLESFSDKLNNLAIKSEIEKFNVQNKDVEKITALMYSLASRMAKYEDYLGAPTKQNKY